MDQICDEKATLRKHLKGISVVCLLTSNFNDNSWAI